MQIADDEIVAAAIARGKQTPESWWITKRGTVLIHRPDVVLWIGCGRLGLKFGVGMPPVFGKEDIAEIPISFKDKNLLWSALKDIKAAQLAERRATALKSIGKDSDGIS